MGWVYLKSSAKQSLVEKWYRKMKLELPYRLSATGMIGLAALSATNWLR